MTSLKCISTYARYIGKLVVNIKVFKICTPHCKVSGQRGTYNLSSHFHCTVLAALCGAGVCLCLLLVLDVVSLPIYAKLWLVVGMTKQISDGKEADIMNCLPSKIMSTERSEVDMNFLGLTIHYIYLLTI